MLPINNYDQMIDEIQDEMNSDNGHPCQCVTNQCIVH